MYESWSNKFIIIDYFLLRMKVKCMAYLITQTIAIRAICKGELQLQITSILSQRQKKQQQHEDSASGSKYMYSDEITGELHCTIGAEKLAS